MKKLLAGLILSIACITPAMAQYMEMAKDSVGTVVMKFDTPCVNKRVIARINHENEVAASVGGVMVPLEDFKAGSVTEKGRGYQACWIQAGDIVIVVDEAGLPNSIFAVPQQDFTQVHEI